MDSASETIEFMDEITKDLAKGLKSSTVDMFKNNDSVQLISKQDILEWPIHIGQLSASEYIVKNRYNLSKSQEL